MKKSTNMRLDVDLIQDAKEIAKDTKRSFTQLVTDLLFQHIKKYKKGEKK